jgi:hypothetical protein
LSVDDAHKAIIEAVEEIGQANRTYMFFTSGGQQAASDHYLM